VAPDTNRFKELVRVIRENDPEGRSGSGVTEETIRQCEQQLGVLLPDSYKCFLREFAWGLFPEYIYGLSPDIPPGQHLVSQTEKLRHKREPKLPHSLIPFNNDGWGNHYCLDTSQLRDGECPVVFWNHELDKDQQPKQTHATFLDWLDETIQWKLELDAEEGAPPNDVQGRLPVE
jgi:hypothetical protein